MQRWQAWLEKIQSCKSAMQLLRSFIVCPSALFWRIKVADKLLFPVNVNARHPFATPCFPTDALESAGIMARRTLVLVILCIRAFTNISTSMVKRIPIYVVALQRIFAIKNGTVHPYQMLTLPSFNIKTFCMVIPTGTPIPLREPLEVICVYDCILPLRQWDQAIRFIKRLYNRMPPNTAFWHGLPPRRFCVQPLF